MTRVVKNQDEVLGMMEDQHRYYYLRQKLLELIQHSSYLLPQLRGRKSEKVETLRKQLRDYLTYILQVSYGNSNAQMCWARCKGMYFCELPAHHGGPHSDGGYEWDGKYDDGQMSEIADQRKRAKQSTPTRG